MDSGFQTRGYESPAKFVDRIEARFGLAFGFAGDYFTVAALMQSGTCHLMY